MNNSTQEVIPHEANAHAAAETTQRLIDDPPTKARSLTRLVVGGVEMGVDELLHQLQTWEQEVIAYRDGLEPAPPQGMQVIELTEDVDSDADLARFALIGLLFETQGQMERALSIVGKGYKAAEAISTPFVRPLIKSRLFSPLRRGFNALVNRGENEVGRWVNLGRAEEAHSRALVKVAVTKTVDGCIDHLTHNEEVKELVQMQSTGLATEVIEEVRERTVSADTLFEGLVRNILRRIPRAHLPEPPEHVRMSATPPHHPRD